MYSTITTPNGAIIFARHFAFYYYSSHDTVWMFETDPTHDCSTDTGIYRFEQYSTPTRDTMEITRLIDHCNGRDLWFNNWSFIPCSIGLEEENEYQTIRMYPNPSNMNFTIENLENQFEKNTQIVFYDLVGNKIIHQDLPKGSMRYTLDLHHLRDGVYFVQVIHENNILTTERVIVVSH